MVKLVAAQRLRHPCVVCNVSARCGWFEIGFNANSNITWFNATASIALGGKLLLSAAGAPADSEVVGARYLWADWPVATLFNGAGFPALPFLLNVTTETVVAGHSKDAQQLS